PININYKGDLLSYSLNDIGPKFVITERKQVNKINFVCDSVSPFNVIVHTPLKDDHDYSVEFANRSLKKNFTEYDFKDFLKGNENNPNIKTYYYDKASIIYTSGTTGMPKGVVLSFRYLNAYTYLARSFLSQKDVIYNDL